MTHRSVGEIIHRDSIDADCRQRLKAVASIGRARMTEVTFIDSLQGHQVERVRHMAERVRQHREDVTVTIVEGDEAKDILAKHKLNFGPAILIDGRLEYVGIPRWRHLQERLAQVARALPNPRTAAPPEKAAAKPAAKPAPEKAGEAGR